MPLDAESEDSKVDINKARENVRYLRSIVANLIEPAFVRKEYLSEDENRRTYFQLQDAYYKAINQPRSAFLPVEPTLRNHSKRRRTFYSPLETAVAWDWVAALQPEARKKFFDVPTNDNGLLLLTIPEQFLEQA